MKFGELLVEEGVITEGQLKTALELQKDNPSVPIGEVLLSLGLIDREQLLGYVETLVFLTGEIPEEELELLDQDEIDTIWKNYKTNTEE